MSGVMVSIAMMVSRYGNKTISWCSGWLDRISVKVSGCQTSLRAIELL